MSSLPDAEVVIVGAGVMELAELDAAACALQELSARAAELTLVVDEPTRSLRIVLEDAGEQQRLSPRQLFALLAGT